MKDTPDFLKDLMDGKMGQKPAEKTAYEKCLDTIDKLKKQLKEK